jgi:hypothetical protein
MTGKALLLTALVAAAVPAAAAEQPKNEVTKLKARVTELEREVARLKTAAKRQMETEERGRLLRRAEELRDKLLAAGGKAKDTPEFKELASLSRNRDAEVRGYVAATLARLPKELGLETLVEMVGDQDKRVARAAVTSLGTMGHNGVKDAVAKLAAGLELWMPTRGPRLSSGRDSRDLLVVACNYLHRAGDKRGVSIFMQHLEREHRRTALEEGLRSPSLSWGSGLISKDVLEQANKWTGGKAGFLPPMKHGHRWWHGRSIRKAAGKLLAWWKKNRDDFAVPAAGEQPRAKEGKPTRPEKF